VCVCVCVCNVYTYILYIYDMNSYLFKHRIAFVVCITLFIVIIR
jgi:hypothetical protein